MKMTTYTHTHTFYKLHFNLEDKCLFNTHQFLRLGVWDRTVRWGNTQYCSWKLPFPKASRSKAWVCCRSLAGTAGSNPGRLMDVCECCVRSSGILCERPIFRREES
jgi:hypothetical protein